MSTFERRTPNSVRRQEDRRLPYGRYPAQQHALVIRAELAAREELQREEFQRQVRLARERLLLAALRRTLWQRVLDALPFIVIRKSSLPS